MWDIPPEVFRDILSRLPAEPLLRLRCVCKVWRDTIDDPSFIRLHLDRQLLEIQDSSNGVGQLILRGDLDTPLYSLSLESLNCDGGKSIKATRLKHNPLERYGMTNKLYVGSCNGIMLISHSGNNYLWNPITLEFFRLPPVKAMSKKLGGLYHSVIGFGYDCAADDYKVVKISQIFDPRDRSLDSETLVYSLKLDSWRRIKDFPHRISRLSGGVYLKGALHWISSTMPLKSMDDLIIGLDLGTEDYRLLPLPSALAGRKKPSAMHLGVLGGCLTLSCYYKIEHLDVWLMKQYGIKNSWTMLFSIAAQDNIGAVETLRPLTYSKCKGQILLQHDKQEFLWLDLESKLFKEIRMHGPPVTFSSQFCLASLVRLKVGHGGCTNPNKLARYKKKQC